jgi:hypothetical protein
MNILLKQFLPQHRNFAKSYSKWLAKKALIDYRSAVKKTYLLLYLATDKYNNYKYDVKDVAILRCTEYIHDVYDREPQDAQQAQELIDFFAKQESTVYPPLCLDDEK